ncbi:winged helix-turn-helix transcriptional regulator [Halobium salinum]|uniref:Winged helix-turn-helix transcriptional regulator n=1 Tax=Halobium salinum TaxID=1364940 RepID=A0ABD5P7S3_9EURY|nr:helix-turn-helix domain-containing protein [Halobium salinum]
MDHKCGREAPDGAPDDATDWHRVWDGLGDALGGKWAFHVLRALDEGDAGFNELRRRVGGITAKTLSARLRELRCRGFVTRSVEATAPPSTSYALTDPGREFVGALRGLERAAASVNCDCDCCADESACRVVTVDAGRPAAMWDC